MSANLLFCNAAFTLLVFFTLPDLSVSDDSHLPSPTLDFNFLHYKSNFRAGDNAVIKIGVLKDFESQQDRHSFNPNVTINNTMGNSSLITGLWCDTDNMRIYFIPIMVGRFYLSITHTHFNVTSNLLSYIVTPVCVFFLTEGPIYEPGGIVSWMDQIWYFVAGRKTTVLILPKDAFGNNVTIASEGQNILNFEVYATDLNGSNVNLPDLSNKGWNEFGYVYIEFAAITAGHLLVHIKHENNSLVNSPLSLTVHPGALDVANCLANWSSETKSFQLSSTMETFVSQRDKFGNLVPGLFEFDIEVVEKGSKLSLPIGDLQCKEVSTGIQSFSFTVVKPGDFVLIISDKYKTKILNMPYEFSIYIGYCDDKQSIVNGSGLEDSVAGEASRFSILLKDAYQYPSPVELERIQVQITVPALSLRVNSQIYPKDDTNGTQTTGMLSYGALGSKVMNYFQSVFSHDNSVENSKTRSSDFDVVYVPEKSGVYEVRIFCANIALNGGRPFIKVVSAGKVNTSLSGIIQYDKKVSSGIVNHLTVRLVDSFFNPVIFQQSRLALQMTTRNGGLSYPYPFCDNYDGTYSGSYSVYRPAYYEICITIDGKRFSPWLFGVDVIENTQFPYARNDIVNVWEDQSIAFDALENDYFVGNVSISEFQKPSHGSLLLYGNIFRYTPYKGFCGNDKFIYSITVANGAIATGVVNMYVLTIPPQFVSSPIQWQAVEDTLSPRFGGFPSFEIKYSDSLENISVILSAQNGIVVLAPLLMQLWDPIWNDISVSKEDGRDGCLYITGRVDVINFALKSFQYMGNANFSGKDIIAITTINKNDKAYLDVQMNVEPINDPPVINVPSFIILDKEKENEGFLIFDRQREKFNFSIEDPDHLFFPGHESHFRVLFSVEVSSGLFSAKLPAQLISTTELKLKTSKQWQPLHTFVEISKHFTVTKVKGIRFRGTINECNTLLHQLIYYGDKHDGVLKLSVNDMGWYGCARTDPSCSEMMSVPLISEATVNLITRAPMNASVAHYLGSLIVIVSIIVIILAVTLIVFACKCAIVLSREKKKQVQAQKQISHEQMPSASSPQNTIQLTGNHPSTCGIDDSHLPSPSLVFNFPDNRSDFRAGDNAVIRIVVLKDFKSQEDRHSFNPNITINDTMGNSSLITGLWCDTNNMKIYFIPIMAGKFNLLINHTRFNVTSNLLSYTVTPGPIYEPGGIVSWTDQISDFVAGTKSTVLILPKDAFGNNVTIASEGQNIFNFEVSAADLNGSNTNLLNISNKGWNEFGYVGIEFVAVTAGHFVVHIKHKNNSLINSPLSLTIHPGALDVANCLAHWSSESKSFQLFSTMETFISQRDKFGNLVPELFEFDVEVVEKGSKLSLPIGDLRYKEVSSGIQSFSFTVIEPGDFILIISDKYNTKIMNMPYEFSIYIGYCDDRQSVLNGSGLDDSVAGEPSRFSILLKDAYQYPSPVELERLQVQIIVPKLSLHVNSQIYPKDYTNGTQPARMFSYGSFGPTGMTYVPSVFSHDNSVEYSKTRSSDFDVVYVPEKSGVYEIRIFCANIALNGGRPFIKVVSAGDVNTSLSGVVQYEKKGAAGIVNYLTVRLMDSFYNPVIFQELKLVLQMASKNGGTFYPTRFYDNYDGTYSGSYFVFLPAYYELGISYEGKHFMPWPFGVDVISSREFPLVHNDTVNVWEDQSIAFNALENDYLVGNTAISEFQKPSHGSLLLYGNLFRYTPYKGFYGYDRFSYTISSANGLNATGHVHMYVLTIAPQFVSSPVELQAIEDTLSPRFSGFPSFEIKYSDPLENISVMLSAQNGIVVLAPLLMQLWDPMWNEISVSKVEGSDGCLYITARVEVINFALKSLHYIGNANFNGKDNIAITTINKNDKGYFDVQINVEPINSPPVINVPKFIILDNEKENKGFLIFDRQRDRFSFSIEDPDYLSFPGHESHFRVLFSVEVSSGTFSAKLPAQLISTTELKLKRSKQWQPLHTFVEISKQFTVNKVKGIRFRGTINECNTLLHQLIYYGDKHDGVLKLSVNDMGWYGCARMDPSCSEMMSMPLISEATVNLITRTPINSLVAHSLGSLILIESIIVTSLALILMCFTCKCVIVLLREKKKRVQTQNLPLNELQNSHEQMVILPLTSDHIIICSYYHLLGF
ncbi:hypothetical protein SSX86_021786 [Deinandra increscens subsp. villosa]|uniref:GEX2 N-terminal Ig-like domain-containing protein n=1 Tax=Deinandra increscens subsp. villosa TaxID=3103831 RepID=A0AAP0CS24_9ASTR